MSAQSVGFVQGAVLPELLRYAVQRHIFCECGAVLDIGTAKLIEIDDKPSAIACPSCFTDIIYRYADLDLDTRAQALGPVEVLDGAFGAQAYKPLVDYLPELEPELEPLIVFDTEQLGFDFGGDVK
tara:strand:- start:521 stop:898 length:378 start_codon:yes stop_codon:yes gene_type:complete